MRPLTALQRFADFDRLSARGDRSCGADRSAEAQSRGQRRDIGSGALFDARRLFAIHACDCTQDHGFVKPGIAIGGTEVGQGRKSAPLLGGVGASFSQPDFPRTYRLLRQLFERFPKSLRIAESSLLNSPRREVKAPQARKSNGHNQHDDVRGIQIRRRPVWRLEV